MQAFTDGLCRVNQMKNIAPKGKMPDWQPIRTQMLRFTERAISIARRATYLQHDMKIDRLIRCRKIKDIATNDTVNIDGVRYNIRKIDYPVNVLPPVMDLALERTRQHDT